MTVNIAKGVILRMRESYHDLSPKEQKVADYIMNHLPQMRELSLNELSAASGSSISTVMRLCKSLQISGYKELVRSLTSEPCGEGAPIVFEDIAAEISPEEAMQRIYQSNLAALENTISLTNPQELETAVSALCKAKIISFFGVGSSGLVGMDAASKFRRINKIAQCFSDTHNQLLSAMTLSADDAAVIISYSGETIDMINVAEEIKKTGATLISVTRFGMPTIASLADIRLYTASTETFLRSGAMSSRIAQLFVIDTLFSSVCSRMFDDVKNHLEQTRLAVQKLHLIESDSSRSPN